MNSEFCLWKVNKCGLKKIKKNKREKLQKWKRKRAVAKTKRVLYYIFSKTLDAAKDKSFRMNFHGIKFILLKLKIEN